MDTNAKRVETALNELHRLAQVALKAMGGSDDPDRGPLEVMSRVTADSYASQMARFSHHELVDSLSNDVGDFGYASPELVAVVNGYKHLLESVDGGWIYEEARWESYPEHRRRILASPPAGVAAEASA